jgi:hypothetical protein
MYHQMKPTETFRERQLALLQEAEHRRETMNTKHKGVGWGLWIRWAIYSLLGLIAGIVAFFAVGIFASDTIDGLSEFVFGVVLGAIFGSSFGITQWWVLRRRLGPVGAWIGATVVGFVLGAAIIFGLMNGSEPDTTLPTKVGHGLVLGASLGIAQWSVLRANLCDARPWIAISVIGWVVAELVGVVLTTLVGPPFDLLGLFLVGAVLPGAGMAWLLGSASTSGSARPLSGGPDGPADERREKDSWYLRDQRRQR